MEKTVKIEKIEFSNFSENAICSTMLYNGVLGFESKLTISQSRLNHLLNYLIKHNEGIDLYSFLSMDTTEFGSYYKFDFSNLNLGSIPLENLQFNTIKDFKICA